MMQAVAAWGQVHTEDVTVETDAVHVEGVLQAEILYLSADDDAAVCVLQRGIPFRQTVEVRGAKAGDTACVRSIAEQVDFRLMTETEGELRAQILLEILVTAMEETEVVTDLLEMPEETPEKTPLCCDLCGTGWRKPVGYCQKISHHTGTYPHGQ